MKKKMIELNKKSIDNITTWNGREVSADKCKYIKGEYYEINVDCFYVLNSKGEYKWTRINTGRIAYNAETGKYELIKYLQENPDLVKGICDETGKEGYFKFNPLTTVILNSDLREKPESGQLCISKEVANKLGYSEYFGTGTYVKHKEVGLSKSHLTRKDVYKYSFRKLSYNADNNNKLYLDTIKEYGENKKYIQPSPLATQASKLLPYSFGCELETSNGIIPKHLLGTLGVVPLKDGSLRKETGVEPYEYTTIPLEGEIGLETLKLLCQELEKRCEFDIKCSMHLHLGGIQRRTEEFVIALYKLCYNIQDEIFDMFPAYKSYPEKYVAHFHKNYCQKLPNLQLDRFKFNLIKNNKDAKLLTKQAFDVIYYWLSDNTVSVTDECWNLNTLKHPKGEMDKWNYLSRYHWINFVPFMFSQKKTVEFRLHTPTFSYIKVSNWLFICAGILQFAEQFTNEILRDEVTYTLDNILDCYTNNFFKSFYETDYSRNMSNYLKQYVEFRKQAMIKSIEKEDWYGDKTIEFSKDISFKFETNELKSLY